MNLKEIKELVEIFNASDIAKLQIKQENFEIKMDKNSNILSNTPLVQPAIPAQLAPTAATQPSQAPIPTEQNHTSGEFITSPMVGTFYHCPSPGAAPYVKVGDTVKKGQTIGIVEAMKIMNEIEADFDCKILAIEANDGQPVEFGSKLVKVEKL
ncbi:acetyl-CoA carboxylase biotin carboxyl carrier protein [Helicobacter anatolicus]|uniref:acetyl-CoA carboxylase biotin carboxyl carrier protein n=1 Tax=Helicobacter anatolicus TaxID=2905874 RepID=UPI001E32DE59|nr:acetyl-CoA carboxylase biotin carboxyl carrier protein [Helicobacter anatolicus]MCE3038767.1 acetyl-CoA carboxylase biotin carboxyl carrier protein [Helicobacter anatolicus]MCE3039736.1 acetyl-CoA carboxylase biotin carboxyl carrier protein [Helicobacter anatolicus]